MNEDLQAPELDQPVLELQAGQEAATQRQQQAGVGTGTVLPISAGGTGSSTQAGALANLGAAPATATYITQTASGGLSAEQALAALATGILKSTTTTGVVSIATIADINALLAVAWASWTPTWTNLTIGNGVVGARYVQMGKIVDARLTLAFGSTTSVSGAITFSLPATSVTYPTADVMPLGQGTWKPSGGALYQLVPIWQSTSTASLKAVDSSGTYAVEVNTSSTVPVVFATNDEISLQLVYEAA